MFAEERTVELVARRGDAVLGRSVHVPAFELTVPATVVSGSDFDVAWTVPQGSPSFDLLLFAGPSIYLRATGLDGPTYRVAGVDYAGAARLTVSAVAQGDISVTVVRSTPLPFEAAPAAQQVAAAW